MYLHFINGVPVNTTAPRAPAGRTRLALSNLIVRGEGSLYSLIDRTATIYSDTARMLHKLVEVNQHLFMFAEPVGNRAHCTKHYLRKLWVNESAFPALWEAWLGAPRYSGIERRTLIRYLGEKTDIHGDVVGTFRQTNGDCVDLAVPFSYIKYHVAQKAASKSLDRFFGI